mmetsp:Transcript_4587/g.11397  ORF Transcript_4587/g.11397 Transcript_4587/m.11397 type:complete len:236 (-) Transcript_4587:450-1157(-)
MARGRGLGRSLGRGVGPGKGSGGGRGGGGALQRAVLLAGQGHGASAPRGLQRGDHRAAGRRRLSAAALGGGGRAGAHHHQRQRRVALRGLRRHPRRQAGGAGVRAHAVRRPEDALRGGGRLGERHPDARGREPRAHCGQRAARAAGLVAASAADGPHRVHHRPRRGRHPGGAGPARAVLSAGRLRLPAAPRRLAGMTAGPHAARGNKRRLVRAAASGRQQLRPPVARRQREVLGE